MSNERRSYSIATELRDDQYRAILREGTQHCSAFSVVQRHGIAMEANGNALLRTLAPFLASESAVSEWPGTKLYKETAVLGKYRLNAESLNILETAANGLYEWCQPTRPEDRVLWRDDDAPWLVTIAHERDSYLVLNRAEYRELLKSIPNIAEQIPGEK